MSSAAADRQPARSGLVLLVLVLGAAVANINTAISNVALPDIGRALDASNEQLTFITDAYQVGIAATVVYLGAVGDRYGRKRMLILGAALSVPFSILSAWAGSPSLLIGAQILTGIAGGMLYPTTLSLIRQLFGGKAMTRAVALWAGVGCGATALGPIAGGVLLEQLWWGAVFLITVPFSIAVGVLAWFVIPKAAGEHADTVDHPGGALSVVMMSSLVVAIVLSPQGITPTVLALFGIALVTGALFAWRELRTDTPIFDLRAARVPTFWAAFAGGFAAFGALVGALFIGQSFTQDVLGRSPLEAVLMTLPMPILMVAMVPVTNRTMNRLGTKFTLVLGLFVISIGFALMLALWHPGAATFWVPFAYAFMGLGVGLAAAPSSRALSDSVRSSRAGMASAAADLTKDMGGAVFQALLGALLTFAYADFFTKAFTHLPPAQADALSRQAATEISASFGGAEAVARDIPGADAAELMRGAQEAFTHGKTAAIAIALLATVLGMLIVLAFYPRREREEQIFADIAQADST